MRMLLPIIVDELGLTAQEESQLSGFTNEVLAHAWNEYKNTKNRVGSPIAWLAFKCKARAQYVETNKYVGLKNTFYKKEEDSKYTSPSYSGRREMAPSSGTKGFYSYIDVIDNFKRDGSLPPRKVQESFVTSYDFKHRMEPGWQQRFLEVTGIEV